MENEKEERNIQSGKGSTISRKESLFRKTFYHVLVNDDVYLTYIYIYIYIYDVIHLLSETLYNYLQIHPQEEERKKEKRTETHIFDYTGVYKCVACSNVYIVII